MTNYEAQTERKLTHYFPKWISEQYIERKRQNFFTVDQHFNCEFKRILDIGCGLAYEARFFNEKYNSELWLMDGDVEDNQKKNTAAKTAKWHDSAQDFLYYNSLKDLDQELAKSGIANYHLVNCEQIDFSPSLKFDLITSWLSCGYHYPVSTYASLIKAHSHADTKLIFDLRLRKDSVVLEEGVFEVVKELSRHGRKNACCEIRLL